MLINRLTDHVFGKVNMSVSQVRAALGLLKKVIPDLKQVDLNTQESMYDDLSDEERINMIMAIFERVKRRRDQQLGHTGENSGR